MARTTDEILAQMLRHLPPAYRPLKPWLAGMAAMFAEAEARGAALAEVGTFEGASGMWLRLHARGYGLTPGPGESDEALRDRLRKPERKIAPEAVLAAVNAALAPYTDQQAVLEEWWDYAVVDDDWVVDSVDSHIVDLPNSFVIRLPLLTDDSDPSIADVAAAVFDARAAGVRWAILLDDEM